MSKKEPIQVINGALEKHPVTQAWLTPDSGRPIPGCIERLRRRKKSVVYRMHGVGADGAAVIAKKCRIAGARVERTFWETLTTLPTRTLRYYGFATDPDAAFGWLFIEDARGEPYDRRNAEHRRLAARWLAGLHTSSQGCKAQVPEVDAAYYLEHLITARALFVEYLASGRLTAEARTVIEAAIDACNTVESRWSDVERTFEILPRTLVHNDFTKSNVHVRCGESEPLAFDWEVAGWGLPTVDLFNADLEEYWRNVRGRWEDSVERRELERGFWIGVVLRGVLASMRWEAQSLSLRWYDGPIQNLASYLRRMKEAQEHLDWCA